MRTWPCTAVSAAGPSAALINMGPNAATRWPVDACTRRPDCGGLHYLVIRYGNFFQVVVPNPTGGHISVAVATDHDPVAVAEQVQSLLF
jgi:hypothetical protein